MPGDDKDDDEKTRDALREMMRTSAAEDTQGPGLEAPMEDIPASDTIRLEDALTLAEKARNEDAKAAAKADAKAEATFARTIDEGAEKKAEDAPKPEAQDAAAKAAEAPPAGTGAKPAEKAPETDDDLFTGLDDVRRGKLTARLSAADEITGLFKGREAELKLHGDISPKQAMERLLYLNEFAQKKPDEYLAWVATQINGEKPHETLSAAAKLLGYKLTPEAETDEFEDEQTKALRAEVAALRRERGVTFGPDAPAVQAQRNVAAELNAFINEKDSGGQPVRPFFDVLRPAITQAAEAHRRTTGNPATLADLDRFYREAEAQAKIAFAAQAPAPVAARQDTAAADALAKAKAASKSIEGQGQGATSQTAIPADADLRTVIKMAMAGKR